MHIMYKTIKRVMSVLSTKSRIYDGLGNVPHQCCQMHKLILQLQGRDGGRGHKIFKRRTKRDMVRTGINIDMFLLYRQQSNQVRNTFLIYMVILEIDHYSQQELFSLPPPSNNTKHIKK